MQPHAVILVVYAGDSTPSDTFVETPGEMASVIAKLKTNPNVLSFSVYERAATITRETVWNVETPMVPRETLETR